MSEPLDTAEAVLAWLAQSTDRDAISRWHPVQEFCRRHRVPLGQCQNWWQQVFQHWPAERGPKPVWCPTPETIAATNLQTFAQRVGVDTDSLHAWSVENRATFWEETCRQLQIRFQSPPKQWLNRDQGLAQAVWLAGATMNIVPTCLPELLGPTDQENQPAIIASTQSGGPTIWRRRELADQVKRFASALNHAGLGQQRIAMFTPMTPASVVIYLAIIYTGGTVVSIADSFSAPEIRRRMDIVQCEWVVTYDQMQRAGRQLPMLDRIHEASRMGSPIRSLVLAVEDLWDCRASPAGCQDQDLAWHDLLAELSFDEDPQCIIQPADQAINLLFSSGTTGDPKAIPWSHTTPIKCAADGWFHHDIHPGDVVAWPTNLGWMMGPWLIFASLINRAAMALYHDAPVGPGFGKFVQDAHVTMLGLVPSMVKSWRAAGDLESFDWSSIRCFSSTGESSNADDYFYLSWLAGFRPIIEYCGGTEIGGGYLTSTMTRCNSPATFNSPALGLDFVILDENDQVADEGELFLIPPSIGLSDRLGNRDHYETYYQGTPLWQGQPLRRHGDHVRRLPNGYYEAGGRADDTMNLGGIKVSSIELERTIAGLDGIRESAAVAVAPPGGGPSELAIFLVLEPEADTKRDWLSACNKLLKSGLNPLFRARSVTLVESLPRTASNKVMRRLLRESNP